VEILQICSILMPKMSEEFSLSERKINLIQFCWDMLKSEDKIIKNIAYIFACKFIVVYGLPQEKIFQIYVSLLKSQEYMNQHDNDVKILSRKALDIIIPFLPQTVAPQPAPGQDLNHQLLDSNNFINWTYRIFNEETSIMNNCSLGRFWHIFIKNHKVYYHYRKAFNTQMINSMYASKLGNSSSSSPPTTP